MAGSDIVKLNKMVQVGIAVHDADSVVEAWNQAFGFSNWEIRERKGIDGKGRPWGTKLVISHMGSMQYELIQPLEGRIAQSRLLDSYGDGIHHIMFTVDDVEEETNKLDGRPGFRVVWKGKEEDSDKIRLSYIEVPGGVTIELVNPRENPTGVKPVGGLVDLGDMLQVGIAVNDIDSVVEGWSKNFGLTNWEEREFTGVQDDGSPWKNRILKTKIGAMELEFMQPVEGRRTQAEFLDKHGDGIHHISFCVDNLAEATEKLIAQPGFNLVVAHPDQLSYIEIPGGFIIELWPMSRQG